MCKVTIYFHNKIYIPYCIAKVYSGRGPHFEVSHFNRRTRQSRVQGCTFNNLLLTKVLILTYLLVTACTDTRQVQRYLLTDYL